MSNNMSSYSKKNNQKNTNLVDKSLSQNLSLQEDKVDETYSENNNNNLIDE